MASGDAQRIWHPEMLDELKQHWRPGMPWGEVIAFCDRMTIMRKELALSKDIKPPMIKCPKCGTRARAAYPMISVRSLIFALQKVARVPDEELKDLDRDWKRYQRKHALNGYGGKKA